MPTVEISPITVQPTPGGFLRAAGRLETDADWQSGGVTFTSNCGGAHTWQCDYSGATKTIDDLGEAVEFEAFLIYAAARCNGGLVPDRLREHVDIKLARGSSGALAYELATGDATGNPSLQSEAEDQTPGAGICVDAAIAALLSFAEDCGGGELTFHIPFVGLASLMKYHLVTFEGGVYRIGGHRIIVDAYPNVGPDISGNVVATDDQVWVYVTGPVEFVLGSREEYHQFTHRTNDDVLIKEQLAALRFDPCCVHAILAELC